MASGPPEPELARLRWGTTRIGCMLPLMAAAAALLLAMAIDSDVAQEVGRSGRRSGIVRELIPLTVGGVNFVFLAIAAWLVWELFRFSWRWADEVAATATPSGIRFHRSLWRAALPWSDVDEVTFRTMRRTATADPIPAISIRYRRSGRQRTLLIRNVDNEDGAAERFARFADARISGARTD